jgi:hypothetical protein
MAGELLRVLSVQGAGQWHDVVMLDESWFDLRSRHDLMWTAPGEIVPTENQHHSIAKIHGEMCVESKRLPHCESLPKWSKFKAQYYTNNILVAISDWRRLSERTQQGKLWLHADKARPHKATCRPIISPVTG